MNSKWRKLANLLVTYSTKIRPGEIALIHCVDDANEEFIGELIEEIFQAGGEPIIWRDHQAWLKRIIEGDSDRALKIAMRNRLAEIKKVQVVFHLFSERNVCEFSDLPADKIRRYRRLQRSINDWRCNRTKRVLTCLPVKAAAQLAGMSSARFQEFYFDVCLGVDYQRMSPAMDLLLDRMRTADLVRIANPNANTDLSFSIKGMSAVKCAGEENLPDGEVFTAPIRDSVNGSIVFNTLVSYGGKFFDGISLFFENGKIIDADCRYGDCHDLQAILDTDEGARYVGEFAFGLNPKITKPIGEILYDEKIAGSVHWAIGSCYDQAPNGNQSAIHWDLILRQTADCGGGQVFLDGELVRQDGLFLGELAALNPDNLQV